MEVIGFLGRGGFHFSSSGDLMVPLMWLCDEKDGDALRLWVDGWEHFWSSVQEGVGSHDGSVPVPCCCLLFQSGRWSSIQESAAWWILAVCAQEFELVWWAFMERQQVSKSSVLNLGALGTVGFDWVVRHDDFDVSIHLFNLWRWSYPCVELGDSGRGGWEHWAFHSDVLRCHAGALFRAFPVIGQWALSSPCNRFSAVGPLFWVVPASSFWRWRICPLRSEWFVLRCSLASGIFVRLEWKTREGFLLTFYWQFVRTLSSIRPLLWRGSPWVSLVLLSRSRITKFNSPFLWNGITGIKNWMLR